MKLTPYALLFMFLGFLAVIAGISEEKWLIWVYFGFWIAIIIFDVVCTFVWKIHRQKPKVKTLPQK